MLSVNLNSGRLVQLDQYFHMQTYLHLLEGHPREKINEDVIKRAVDQGRNVLFGKKIPVYLIEPNIKFVPEDVERSDAFLKHFGRKAILPAVLCIGKFSSHSPARDKSKDCSELAVLWFQDKQEVVIDEAVMPNLRQIPWDAYALDGEY